MDEFRNHLSKRFKKITEQRNPNYFNYLGMNIKRVRDQRKMLLSQPKHVKEILETLEVKHETADCPYTTEFNTPVINDPLLEPHVKSIFARATMQMLYIAKEDSSWSDATCVLLYNQTTKPYFDRYGQAYANCCLPKPNQKRVHGNQAHLLSCYRK